MRISDWSSDVCSSDLPSVQVTVGATMTVEAGCVLADAQRHATEAGLLLPLSLGSEGSCQIGGVVATNAGGINVLRYGPTRDLVLGLEYVLADGRVVDDLSRLRKDNKIGRAHV